MKEKWFEYQSHKIWNLSVQTGHAIEVRRINFIVIDKVSRKCQIIEFAVPYDNQLDSKETEMIKKYQDLATELKTIEHNF